MKKLYPLPHQRICIESSITHFEMHDRMLIEMACGTGKTMCAYWIAERISTHTLILVPSLQLLSQFYKNWHNQTIHEKRKIKYLLVGSDVDSVVYENNDAIVSTNPVVIRNFIENYSETEFCVISTYQSCDKLVSANITKSFGLAIFDEAHKTTGPEGKKFALLLHQAKDKLRTGSDLKIKKRLFMTATPKIYNGDLKTILSMKNHEIYGECAYVYNTGDAIHDGRLSDYELCIIFANREQVYNFANHKKIKPTPFGRASIICKMDSETQFIYIAHAIILIEKLHKNKIHHLVTYHNRVASAIWFAECLNKICVATCGNAEIFVSALSGEDSIRTRNQEIRNFCDSKKAVLCTAKTLNEGVDIPIIDAICFVDARFSAVDIIQCVGRSLRLHPGKSKSKILVPIILKNDEITEWNSTSHSIIFNILGSLKNTDGGIVEFFKCVESNKQPKRKIMRHETFKNCKVELAKCEKVINKRVWSKIDDFTKKYEMLSSWIEIYGEMPSLDGGNTRERKMAAWCEKMRTDYAAQRLSESKIAQLENLKLWKWDIMEAEASVFEFRDLESKSLLLAHSQSQRTLLELALCMSKEFEQMSSKLAAMGLTRVEVEEPETLCLA